MAGQSFAAAMVRSYLARQSIPARQTPGLGQCQLGEIVAGLLEVCWAIGLKYSGGFTRLWPSLWTVLTMIASFFCLIGLKPTSSHSMRLERRPIETGLGDSCFGPLGRLSLRSDSALWRPSLRRLAARPPVKSRPAGT
ncbi:MAG TPA: SMR family transporter [Pirellulales bacterium]|nr:SMR family transporter [Pirellulales bacterium]